MSIESRLDSIDKKFKPITEDFSEERIKEIIRKLIFDENFSLEENDLLAKIIKLIKCDLKTAKEIFQKMNKLGLEVCRSSYGYSIQQFAEIRGYVSDEEFKKLSKEIEEREHKQQREYEESERRWKREFEENKKKFIEKHGPQSKWSEDVWDEYMVDGENE